MNIIRIVSWNCNGAFRKKYTYIKELDADIYIIQECENPNNHNADENYNKFVSNSLWKEHGHFKKGLGIFPTSRITVKDNHWESYGLDVYISVRVNDTVNILGVWACDNYIEDFYTYCKIHQSNLHESIICGDFNSNSCWDKKHGVRTHSETINLLENISLYSCYHYITSEPQGKETLPTFFMHRNTNKPYHIDYCLCRKELISDFRIESPDKWLPFSDHMPIIIDVKL